MLTRTILREGQALAQENGAALEVVRNIREVSGLVNWALVGGWFCVSMCVVYA